MTKLISTLAIVVMGLVALAAVGPALAKLVTALVPLVAVISIAVIVARLVWWHTRH
jgi:hypothetical protein